MLAEHPSSEAQNLVALLAPALISGVVVAIVGAFLNRRLKHVEARLANLTGFNQHRLEAHELLWTHLQTAKRAQLNVQRLKREKKDCSSAAGELAVARRDLKNFVFDKGLYFVDDTRSSVMELDRLFGDPSVDNVGTQVAELEAHLRERVATILAGKT